MLSDNLEAVFFIKVRDPGVDDTPSTTGSVWVNAVNGHVFVSHEVTAGDGTKTIEWQETAGNTADYGETDPNNPSFIRRKPPGATEAELEAGTVTQVRTIAPSVFKAAVEGIIGEIPDEITQDELDALLESSTELPKIIMAFTRPIQGGTRMTLGRTLDGHGVYSRSGTDNLGTLSINVPQLRIFRVETSSLDPTKVEIVINSLRDEVIDWLVPLAFIHINGQRYQVGGSDRHVEGNTDSDNDVAYKYLSDGVSQRIQFDAADFEPGDSFNIVFENSNGEFSPSAQLSLNAQYTERAIDEERTARVLADQALHDNAMALEARVTDTETKNTQQDGRLDTLESAPSGTGTVSPEEKAQILADIEANQQGVEDNAEALDARPKTVIQAINGRPLQHTTVEEMLGIPEGQALDRDATYAIAVDFQFNDNADAQLIQRRIEAYNADPTLSNIFITMGVRFVLIPPLTQASARTRHFTTGGRTDPGGDYDDLPSADRNAITELINNSRQSIEILGGIPRTVQTLIFNAQGSALTNLQDNANRTGKAGINFVTRPGASDTTETIHAISRVAFDRRVPSEVALIKPFAREGSRERLPVDQSHQNDWAILNVTLTGQNISSAAELNTALARLGFQNLNTSRRYDYRVRAYLSRRGRNNGQAVLELQGAVGGPVHDIRVEIDGTDASQTDVGSFFPSSNGRISLRCTELTAGVSIDEVKVELYIEQRDDLKNVPTNAWSLV